MIPYRYAEAGALVPLLHVRPGPTTVRVAGSLAPLLAAEALRWRDTVAVLTDVPIIIRDARVKVWDQEQADVILLSPDIGPENFIPSLKKHGVIQASTATMERLPALRAKIKVLTGSAVPYRDYMPEPVWFVIGAVGSMPRRVRRPPEGARRVTERFLPALFSFGKDEIQTVFGPGEKS